MSNENDPSPASRFLQVYENADNRIYDESTEDPFPAYIDDVDTSLAPFCPTSAKRVLKALRMAQIRSDDVVVDLGSGDGRFVTAAVSEFDASKAVGIESDEALVATSKALAQQVLPSTDQPKVSFILGDLLDLPKMVHDIQWTVIVVFLLPDHTDKFSDFLLKYYRKGARIVSLVFNLNEIPELNLLASDEPDGIYVYGEQ
ncbi:MAG: S-adenosyl-L-methionine-dependent methyltransferase [Benjaminiella poitrasii]|nr:MAG: S-adenosyl-L-methionine-dependent methyltransferase [Benjaminiella poitrasii]